MRVLARMSVIPAAATLGLLALLTSGQLFLPTTVPSVYAASAGQSDSGDTSAPSTPGTPSDNQPTASTTSTSVTWSWSASTDNVGVTAYEFSLGTSAGGTDVMNGTNIGNVTSYTASGLSSGSTYYAKVRARDTAGNTSAYSGNSDGLTVDAVAPTFSNLSASASGTSVTVTWTTNEASTSQLRYGTSSGSLSSSTSADSSLTTSHSVTISSLSAGTTYYVQAVSADALGNSGTSSQTSASTPAATSSSNSSSSSSTSSSSEGSTVSTQTTSTTSAATDAPTDSKTTAATTESASVAASAATAPTASSTAPAPSAAVAAVTTVQASEVPNDLSPWFQFAVSYAMIGALLAVLASLGHWLLPYLANTPSTGDSEAIARRVHRIQALARGFGWLEYPLIAFGTVVQGSLLLTKVEPTTWWTTLFGLYAALWCLQILFWLKRPIVGKVSTPRQQPVPFAVVRLFHAGTNKIYATLATEKDGRFGFHVHTGKYDLRAGKAGYSATTATESVGPHDSLRANLVLTPGSPEPTLTKPASTSSSFWDLAAKHPAKLVK